MTLALLPEFFLIGSGDQDHGYRISSRSSRSRNLLSGKVLLIEVKLSCSSFVRGAFVFQVNPIKFEECGGNMADVQNAAI